MLYIGIDLGGTDIKSAIVDENCNILAKFQQPTLVNRDYKEIVADMAACALKSLELANLSIDDIASVGVGIPGIADNKTGRVIFCTNLFWEDIPLAQELQKYINKPIYIDNDASVAGYAEYLAGVSKGTDSSVFITLGTGIGGGIIINGKPWSGFHGVGSEIGHAPLNITNGVPCTCGNLGCVERYCSATAIIRMAKEALSKDNSSMMLHMADNDLNKINAKIVIDAAKIGDKLALEVFENYTYYLAKAIIMIINIIDPEVIVLGGGVSKAGDYLLDAVNKKIPQFLLFKKCKYPQLLIAKLGADAGVIGAALLGM